LEEKSFKKDAISKDEVEKQRTDIEKLIAEVVLGEEDLQSLKQEKKISEVNEKKAIKDIEDQKQTLEKLIIDLEKNEVLLADSEEVKTEEVQEDVVAEVDSKDEEKEEKEETKEEEKVAQDECKHDDQVVGINQHVETLINDQRQIM